MEELRQHMRGRAETGAVMAGCVAACVLVCACYRSHDRQERSEPGPAVCGDGVAERAERCDDGNEVRWDGCDACSIVEFQVNQETQGYQQGAHMAAARDKSFVVAWRDDERELVLARLFDRLGRPSTDEIVVSDTPWGGVGDLQIRAGLNDEGRFLVAWMTTLPIIGRPQLVARTFDADGSTISSLIAFPYSEEQRSSSPQISVTQDGDFQVVFMVGDAFGLPTGQEIQRVVMTPDGTMSTPEVVREAGLPRPTSMSLGASPIAGSVLAFSCFGCDGDPDNEGIHAIALDTEGHPRDAELQVNTYTIQDQSHPGAAMSYPGGFLVGWTGRYHDGDEWGIWARRFNWYMMPQTDEIMLNESPTNTTDSCQVGLDLSGNFAAAWHSDGAHNDSYDVMIRWFDAAGSPRSAETRAHVFTEGLQMWPTMAMESDGSVILVWEGGGDQDGSGKGIFAQRFDASHEPLGHEPW